MNCRLLVLSAFSLVALSGNSRAADSVFERDTGPLDCVIHPSEIVDIGSPVSGIIETLPHTRSDSVVKGALLLQLHAGLEQADFSLADRRASTETSVKLRKAALSLAYKTRDRSLQLQRNSLVSGQEIDQLDTDIRVAELQLELEQNNRELARLNRVRALELLGRKSINSPIDGVVMEIFKAVGERIDDEPIMRIAQLDPLFIDVVVPVEQLSSIKLGMQATVSPRHNTSQHTATVQKIDKVMDAASGTFGVQLLLPNPAQQITAGVLCHLLFTADS